MGIFWKKPLFWIIFFLIILIIIPLSFYFFKDTIISLLPSSIKTETQAPAEPKAGSCLILEEQFCSKGQFVEAKNKEDKPEIYIGFDLPSDTPIFSIIEGQALKGRIGQPSAIEGSVVVVMDPNLQNNTPILDVRGDLWLSDKPEDPENPEDKEDMETRNVKEGSIIAYTRNTGIKNFGKYTVLITIRGSSSKEGAKETLSKLFPYINK